MKDVEKYLETDYDNGIFTEKVNIVDALLMISNSLGEIAVALGSVASVLNRPSPIEVELSGGVDVSNTD